MLFVAALCRVPTVSPQMVSESVMRPSELEICPLHHIHNLPWKIQWRNNLNVLIFKQYIYLLSNCFWRFWQGFMWHHRNVCMKMKIIENLSLGLYINYRNHIFGVIYLGGCLILFIHIIYACFCVSVWFCGPLKIFQRKTWDEIYYLQ